MGAPGFDDSPMRDVPTGNPKHVTFIYPYYENPKFLKQQLKMWEQYPVNLKEFISVIIIDDGSPRDPARLELPLELPLKTRLFRIDVDVRWNWLAARNIGMHYADGWCLMTDMDHVVTSSLAHRLVNGAHDKKTVYRLNRREHTGERIHPHPNTMLLTNGTFWRLGGYDEALSGHYGTDGDWRRRIAAGARVILLPSEITRYEYVGDSSTTYYKRKQPEDAGKKAIIAARGHGWKPKTLSFPYHEVLLCTKS
jgi:hypothetical protein